MNKLILATTLGLLLVVAACGDDSAGTVGVYGGVVGGPCRDPLDCAPGAHCELGGDFPDGTCTLTCRDPFDCPGGTACIDKHGGVCLLYCRNEFDCRPGYKCKPQDARGEQQQPFVCIK